MDEAAVKEKLQIEVNADFQRAIDLIVKSSANIFITGKAGTGKSTFLQYCRKEINKKLVVLAPTGVAAVNVQGQTIQSFFHFKPDITVEAVSSIKIRPDKAKIYKKLELMIIDEISMVRADLIDCVDAFLRLYGPEADKVFGGVQIIFIGDLYQLAPVVPPDERQLFQTVYKSPYFFDAHVFNKVTMEIIEFEKNYRQKDTAFLDLLNAIRNNDVTQENIDILNTRQDALFQPKNDAFYVYLTTTNKLADAINYERLHALNEDLFTYEGKVRGDFTNKNLPTHEILDLKVGAQVMLLNNDMEKRWINGSIGEIVDIFKAGFNSVAIQVVLSDGTRVEVEPFTWEIHQFYYDEKKDAIASRMVGSFKQFPMKLAWAMTIHKSQGKTFDNIIIDVGQGAFCHGQMYVALSRCTTFEGIILKRAISLKDIRMDKRVAEFLTEYQYAISKRKFPQEEKLRIIYEAIEKGLVLEIVYLKENNQRNRRNILPKNVHIVEREGNQQYGIEAFCLQRQENWIFRLEYILELQVFEEIVAD